jgi:hypothetical protein
MLPWIIGETLCGASLNPGRPHYNMINTRNVIGQKLVLVGLAIGIVVLYYTHFGPIAARKQEKLDDLVNSLQISGFKSQSNFRSKFKRLLVSLNVRLFPLCLLKGSFLQKRCPPGRIDYMASSRIRKCPNLRFALIGQGTVGAAGQDYLYTVALGWSAVNSEECDSTR